ncbi:hypothetical protein BGZ49_008628 [Haplosporangium sp. Z 27]|nr:hypothetical protein BGZ49_008628 [Haplosporangium sp. Z 27]
MRPGMGTVIPECLPASLTKLRLDSPYLFTQTFVNIMVRLSNLISLEAKVRLTLSEGTEVTEILSQDWGMPWTEKAKPQNPVSLKRY